MSDDRPTLDASASGLPTADIAPVPGLLLLFSCGRPMTACIPWTGDGIELGRDHEALAAHHDPRLSRRHVQVRRESDRWIVTDLGSRNGTIVDGEPLPSRTSAGLTHVLRVGDSLLIPVQDIGPLQRLGVRLADGRVDGPSSQLTLLATSRAAQLGKQLHITGESGAGKEALARMFHAAGPAARGPFRAINCATIPEGVAERLLFGARRGAYSGASGDAEGYFQAAHGGTLFLDEIAELPLAVQAKLLRTLETGELLPLGASSPLRVDLRFCSATHKDLRSLVAAGKFREDLLYRISAPSLRVPPLRERPEEIPWLLQMAVEHTSPGIPLHISLVEACLLRRWPGNVRELLGEARGAAQAAAVAGVRRVEAGHLAASAGMTVAYASGPTGSTQSPATTAAPLPATAAPPRRRLRTRPSREELERVLIGHAWSIRATAKHFACERKQIWRWIEMYALQSPAGTEESANSSLEGD